MPYQWDPRVGQLTWVDDQNLSGGSAQNSYWIGGPGGMQAPSGGGGGGGMAGDRDNSSGSNTKPRSSSSANGTGRAADNSSGMNTRTQRSPNGNAPVPGEPPQPIAANSRTNWYGNAQPGPSANPLPLGRPAPKVGVPREQLRGGGQPAYDPIGQQQGILDDWNYETERENQEWYNNQRYLDNQDNINQQQWEQQTAGNNRALGDLYGGANRDQSAVTQDMGQRRDYYNSSDRQALDTYTNTNNAALGTFNSRNADLYNTQVPMLDAAQWQSNSSDIRNQNQALGNFGDIYGGSLDYQSQGAQAYADPATIGEQWNVYGQLQGAAQGSLDTQSQAAQAYASAESVSEQKAALANLKGLANTEGEQWQNLKDVTQQYKDLSDPEITDQERFIITEFQQRREDMERSAREARMSDMAARGLRSGAAESTAMQGAQQELGRESVLTELGAQANAIGRADKNRAMWGQASEAGVGLQQQAAGMYYDAAGQLRSQEFDEAYSRGLAADQTSIANADRKLSAMGMSAQQINEMRNASFNEAYSRGVAADNASANNQATRLSGANSYANQANTIRADNDAVGTFNANQRNVVGMNNQSVQLADLNRRQGVANDDLYGTTHVTGNNLAATNRTNDTAWGRDTTVAGAQQQDIYDRVSRGESLSGAQQGLINGTQTGRAAVNDQARQTGQERRDVFTGTAGQRSQGKSVVANQNLIRRTGQGANFSG